ncbi:MAG TPA: hypothetical protein VMH39_08300, partial [Gemmatimonadaceae bacterium]|nr:hypothetical protein [Gemmatimonadaceae bacterium]
RNRPSILVWLDGSDNPPPAPIESTYVSILTEYGWPNPVLSSASGTRAQYSGPSGVKMSGPYDWVAPSYWLLDASHGGAFGFNTETSPGAAVPPAASIRRMLPDGDWWPMDSAWLFHAGGGQFANLKTFSDALTARYGPPSGMDDYAEKAQVMTYESERAMFEAYGRNRYVATGVIQWMLENGWPSMIWHLYDFFLRPGGGYFGAKKALEPVHVMYSYDDRSIAVINQTDSAVRGATVTARVMGRDAMTLSVRDTTLDIPPDTVVRLASIPVPAGVTGAYFVELQLTRASQVLISTNVYWLSTEDDVLDLAKSTWYGTPMRAAANFTALEALPTTTVVSSVRFERSGSREVARVRLSNPGRAVAFFVTVRLEAGGSGDEILPVLWRDNDVTLFPGESREITATVDAAALGGKRPVIAVSGWNVQEALARAGP